ncbi:MAG: glycosyltransferase [Clostridiales bacterium]|jgi:tetratricopeptide (TPR) repeat protein|nr:glycosyltransferase [Clostridiales bacterium]
MATLSVCLIVRDEEDVLARCLDSAALFADEIVVVDTGSVDSTKEIAGRYTDKVYDFAWTDDFSAARNFSFSKATGDFLMWLDADDVVEGDNPKRIRGLMRGIDGCADVVMLRYDAAFRPDGSPSLSYHRERIIRRSLGLRWEGRVHEAIPPTGRVVSLDIAVSHRKLKTNEPGRNLRICEKQEKIGEPFSPRELYYYGRELFENKRYDEAIAKLTLFLSRPDGWPPNKIDAGRVLAECHKALERPDEALRALLLSLRYGPPTGETCCEIGKVFISRGDWAAGAFWMEAALSSRPDIENGGFVCADCYGFVPHIWLAVCYDRLGDKDKASVHNEAAAAERPDDPSVLANREYFAKVKRLSATECL